MSNPPHEAPPDGELDELLRPSIGEDRPAGTQARRPWRLESQLYVAFFGGAAAAAAIGVLNARALKLSPARQWAIAGLGLAGLAGSALVLALIGTDQNGDSSLPPVTVARVVAIVAWGGMYLLQRTADRVFSYHAREDEPYASLWGPGFAAVIVGALIHFTFIYATVGEGA